MGLKEDIYSVISDIDIIKYYTKISEAEINYLLSDRSHKICNPLRNDTRPSLGMRRKTKEKDKIVFKDFADPLYNGDVFDIVGKILRLNSRKDFAKICNHIIENLILSNNDITVIPTYRTKTKKVYVSSNEQSVFHLTTQGWTNHDLRYWHNIANNKAFTKTLFRMLQLEQVYIPNTVYKDEQVIYSYNQYDRAYAYYYETTVDRNHILKLYLPDRVKGGKGYNKTRFITNDKHKYRGLKTNSNKNDVMIMTKSFKDALFLITSFLSTGLTDRVNLYYIQGESMLLSKNEYERLTIKYKVKIWLMDYDKTGIINTYYHINLDNTIIPLFIKSSNKELFTMDELFATVNLINENLDTELKASHFGTFVNNVPSKSYFNGIKDFTELLEKKQLKYISKLIKLLYNGYIKGIKRLHGTNV